MDAVARVKISMLPMLLLFFATWFFSDTTIWPEFLLAALAALVFTGYQKLKLDREFEEGRVPVSPPEPKRRAKIVGWCCGVVLTTALYLPVFFSQVPWIKTAEFGLLALDVIFLWWLTIWASNTFTESLRASWEKKKAGRPR